MMPVEALDQTEIFLSLRNNDEMTKGIWTGTLGGVGSPTLLFLAFEGVQSGNNILALQLFVLSILMLGVPFFWEILSPLSPPTVFNRRTREVYFQYAGRLYHTPWDDIGAVAYEYKMVHQNIGAMTNSPLEILMQRFGKPDDRIFVALGLPMGKTLELQQHVWAYLQRYMDNGPYLDENGDDTSSSQHTWHLLQANQTNRRDDIKLAWEHLRETGSGVHVLQVFLYSLIYPTYALWDITRAIAIKRSQYNWPEEVLERLKPDGPTSRLIDIENEHVQSGSSGDSR